MLKRKASEALLRWSEKQDRRPLIIQGARQVGKTYLARNFAAEHYAALYELNFLENRHLSALFQGDLSADTLLSGIRMSFPETRFVPGGTLIFLDELQACPQAATALKFLAGDSRFDVIASGSALGMLHEEVSSWPVGQVEYLDMYALDFEEFLWASGMEGELTAELYRYASAGEGLPEGIHARLLRLLRRYLVLGGMPDVLNAFFPEEDFVSANETQRRIYRDYLADIAHYAEGETRIKARRCYESIPAQLSKSNHKFQYETVEHRGSARKFLGSVDWLTASGMACRAYNVSAAEFPLRGYALTEQYRLYPNDIGLLMAGFDLLLKRALLTEEDSPASEAPAVRTVKGYIYEALAADMLQKRGMSELYFYRSPTGDTEIEFLLENKDGVIPLEIKAGHNRTPSLDKLLLREDIPYGYKLAEQNAGVSGKKRTLPLYLLPFLPS